MKYKIGDVLKNKDNERTVIAVIEPSCYIMQAGPVDVTLFSEGELEYYGYKTKSKVLELTIKEISEWCGMEVKIIK
jgi:hypothetical protein